MFQTSNVPIDVCYKIDIDTNIANSIINVDLCCVAMGLQEYTFALFDFTWLF